MHVGSYLHLFGHGRAIALTNQTQGLVIVAYAFEIVLFRAISFISSSIIQRVLLHNHRS
jgi:divalent metal cation (Fe/Co/Zn/Cd) transporter